MKRIIFTLLILFSLCSICYANDITDVKKIIDDYYPGKAVNTDILYLPQSLPNGWVYYDGIYNNCKIVVFAQNDVVGLVAIRIDNVFTNQWLPVIFEKLGKPTDDLSFDAKKILKTNVVSLVRDDIIGWSFRSSDWFTNMKGEDIAPYTALIVRDKRMDFPKSWALYLYAKDFY